MPLLLLLEEVEGEMPFHTDRGAIRLRWNSGGTERAFYVRQKGYEGDDEEKPAQYKRGVTDGALLRSFGTRYRQVNVILLVKETPGGATIYTVQEGSIDELYNAWAATDLECLSFADEAYWNAEWISLWPPRLEFDPMRALAVVPMVLVQRS